MHNDITHSHGAVRECCNGDDASQWNSPIFDPRPQQNSLTDFTKIGMRDYIMDGTRHANFHHGRFRSFCFPNTWLRRAPEWRVFMFVFGVLATRCSPNPWTDFYAKYVKRRSCVESVPFWVLMTKYYIQTPILWKTRNFGDRSWLDSLCGRKPL